MKTLVVHPESRSSRNGEISGAQASRISVTNKLGSVKNKALALTKEFRDTFGFSRIQTAGLVGTGIATLGSSLYVPIAHLQGNLDAEGRSLEVACASFMAMNLIIAFKELQRKPSKENKTWRDIV